jgi:hypothetical protein
MLGRVEGFLVSGRTHLDAVNHAVDSYVAQGQRPDGRAEAELVRNLIGSWTEHPHSAMEMLLVVARVYPLAFANSVVASAVTAWKGLPDYSWKAGGSADHCFLAALALTANGALADPELVASRAKTVISTYGTVSHRYGRWDLVEDDNMAKVSLLVDFLRTGVPLALEDCYEAERFDASCRLVIPDFEQINSELIAYFAEHPDHLQELSWRKFEELLDAVFKNQGYATELGPGIGDGGVDLRLIYKDTIGQVLTLVQAKRYAAGNPINLQAVQALHGVVTDQRAHRGLFVTTSRYLPVARDFAERQNGRLILATSRDVAAWCKTVACPA